MDDAQSTSERITGPRRGRLGTTLGAVAALAVTAVGAAHTLATADLARQGRRAAAQHLAAAAPEPETTGSLASSLASARASRLDPCRAAARFPAEP